MELARQKLRKLSKVLYVFAKIGFIASIVGVVLCAAAIIWGVATGSPLSSIMLFGSEVKLVSVHGAEANIAVVYGTISYALTSCSFLIGIMHLLMRLFKNMSDNYTPFTMENAMLLKRTAILMIVAAIVPTIVGESVGMTCAKLMSLPFTADYGDGFSLVVVLVFFAMSLVFQYGCALQEQADTTL